MAGEYHSDINHSRGGPGADVLLGKLCRFWANTFPTPCVDPALLGLRYVRTSDSCGLTSLENACPGGSQEERITRGEQEASVPCLSSTTSDLGPSECP